MSRGYKNWIQFEQHYSPSVFNFYFFAKKIRRQMSSNLVSTPLYECQSWWTSTLRDMRPWRQNLCALRLVRCKTIDLFPLRHWNLRNLTLQQECYLTSTRAFFRTFARLYNAAATPASRLRSAGSLAIAVDLLVLQCIKYQRNEKHNYYVTCYMWASKETYLAISRFF